MSNLELCFLFDYWLCPEEIIDSASSMIVTRDKNMGLPKYYETIRFGTSPFHEPAKHSACYYVSEDEASYAINVPMFKRLKIHEVGKRFFVKLDELLGDVPKDSERMKRIIHWAFVTKNDFIEVDKILNRDDNVYEITVNSKLSKEMEDVDLDISKANIFEDDIHVRRYPDISSRYSSEESLYDIWCTLKDTLKNMFSNIDWGEANKYVGGFLCWLRNTYFSTTEKPGWKRFNKDVNLYHVSIWCDPQFGNGAYFDVKYTDPKDIYGSVEAIRVEKDGQWLGWEEIIELSQKYQYGLVWDLSRDDFCVTSHVP